MQVMNRFTDGKTSWGGANFSDVANQQSRAVH
jgi:hypothetical protein